MVKTPRTRHSKATKDPVTIDLSPGEVARVKSERESAEAASGAMDKTPGAARETEMAGPDATAADVSTRATDDTTAGEHSDLGAPSEESPADEPSTADKEAEEAAHQQTFGRERQTEPTRRGVGAPLLAGIAGGVIALALAGGLQFAGVLPTVGAGGSTAGADVAALEAKLDELEGQVSAISQTSGDAAALTARLASAEQRIDSLGTELETLRGELAGAGGNDAPIDLAPLEDRISALETAIAGIGGAPSPEAALAALEEQFETLQGQVNQGQDAWDAANARLDAIEKQVTDIASRLEDQAEAPGTAVIIAASALKAAIDRGGPFMTELETFASLAPEAPQIAELRDLAAAGVPTRAEISSESDTAANAMIAAARPSDPNAGIVDRLWGSAMGLVQVRPIGMVEGEGVPEIVARIDAAVTSNDYGRAIEEFETLPEAAKTAGQNFMDKVRARQSADTLIDQALAAALKA